MFSLCEQINSLWSYVLLLVSINCCDCEQDEPMFY
jgi:hypothetical protein